jgi:hypothetical protein
MHAHDATRPTKIPITSGSVKTYTLEIWKVKGRRQLVGGDNVVSIEDTVESSSSLHLQLSQLKLIHTLPK